MSTEEGGSPDVFAGLEIQIEQTPLEEVASNIMLVFAGRPPLVGPFGETLQRTGDKTSERMADGSIVELVYRREVSAGDGSEVSPTRYKVVVKKPVNEKTGERRYTSYSWEYDKPSETGKVIEGAYLPGHPDSIVDKRDIIAPNEEQELLKIARMIVEIRAKRSVMTLDDMIELEEGGG